MTTSKTMAKKRVNAENRLCWKGTTNVQVKRKNQEKKNEYHEYILTVKRKELQR